MVTLVDGVRYCRHGGPVARCPVCEWLAVDDEDTTPKPSLTLVFDLEAKPTEQILPLHS